MNTTKIHGSNLPAKWRRYANTDDILDAWNDGIEKGVKEGKKRVFSELEATFEENLKKTFRLSELLRDYIMKDQGVVCSMVTVRPESINAFESLFAVDSEAYLRPDFRKAAYGKARELSKSLIGDNINLEFIITSSSPELNQSILISNGYSYMYRPEPIGKKKSDVPRP